MSHAPSLPLTATGDRHPRWACELSRLLEGLANPNRRETSERDRERVWLLAHTAIARYARAHAGRLGWMQREDLEDLVSEKTLELIQRHTPPRAAPRSWNGSELARYLSSIARNGVVDSWRRRRIRTARPACPGPGEPEPEVPLFVEVGAGEDSSVQLERVQLASALAHCVARLDPRARKVWTLRVLLDWPSREVAVHPDVRRTPSHVDVMLQRARDRVRACLESKGFHHHELPRGCFATIWKHLSESACLPPDGDPR